MARGIEGQLDRIVPPYFIFGDSGDVVDLADANGDVIVRMQRSEAERLIADQRKLRLIIIALAEQCGIADLTSAEPKD